MQTQRRILVVDDEKDLANILAFIMKGHGWEPRVAYSGHAAITAATDFRPDIVLTDIEMPDMDGIEACIRIRSALPQCRFILFSGQGSRIDFLEKARRNRIATEIVTKPIEPRRLLHHLEYVSGISSEGALPDL